MFRGKRPEKVLEYIRHQILEEQGKQGERERHAEGNNQNQVQMKLPSEPWCAVCDIKIYNITSET